MTNSRTDANRLTVGALALILPALLAAAPAAERVAAVEKGLPAYRVHNVRFDLPPGWEPPGRGTERPGTPVIYPVPYPNGEVVRFDAGFPQPGEEGAAALSQAYLREMRKHLGETSVVELSPADHRKHARGYDMVTQHLSMPERGVGTAHFVVIHLTGKYRGQTVLLKASKPDLLAKYRPDFERIVAGAVLLSNIELTPEVAELGSLDLYDVYRTQDYLEWLLDAKLSDAHRHAVGGHLADTWSKGDRKACESIAQTLSDFEALRPQQGAEVELARAAGRVQMLRESRAQAKAGDAKAKLMLEVYHASHPPLAGDAADLDQPPLTRHASDATLRLVMFMAAKVANPHGGIGADAKPPQAALDAWAKQLAEAYPQLSKENKEELAQTPLVAATLAYAWPKLPAEERAALIDQWKQLPFVQQLAGANRADHQHLRDLQAVMRGFDAQQRLTTMGAYRLNYWRW